MYIYGIIQTYIDHLNYPITLHSMICSRYYNAYKSFGTVTAVSDLLQMNLCECEYECLVLRTKE